MNSMTAMPTRQNKTRAVDVIIVGAGHSGLAMSACLADMGIDHVIFEKGEIANSWAHERWDSLRLLTPNWMTRLPGQAYDGDDPDGFMDKQALATHIQTYADMIKAPVETHTEVSMVTTWGDGYRVVTNQGEWWCRAIVNASGAYNTPITPNVASSMPLDMYQLHAGQYKNVDQLPDGGVLVVGASATGLQLANEIHASGRSVTLAAGEHVRMPRTYRGSDIFWWLANVGVLEERYDEVEDITRARRVPSPQLVGNAAGNLDLNALSDSGVQIVGRLVGNARHKLQFSGSLANHCKSADLKLKRLLSMIDDWADFMGMALPKEVIETTQIPQADLEISTKDGGIKTIVWATGFKADRSWLKLPVYDHKGGIKHDGGIVDLPGVYTMGLPLMRTRKSSYIFGVEDDAKALSQHLSVYLNSQSMRYAS